jgi:hypothetical protein
VSDEWRNNDEMSHYQQGYEKGQSDALAEAVRRVEAAHQDDPYKFPWDALAIAIAAMGDTT